MPIKHHSAKALRQAKKHALINHRTKKTIKDLVREIRQALVAGKKEEAQKIMQVLQQKVDKAIHKRILKPNTGNRKKSRLATALKK